MAPANKPANSPPSPRPEHFLISRFGRGGVLRSKVNYWFALGMCLNFQRRRWFEAKDGSWMETLGTDKDFYAALAYRNKYDAAPASIFLMMETLFVTDERSMLLHHPDTTFTQKALERGWLIDDPHP